MANCGSDYIHNVYHNCFTDSRPPDNYAYNAPNSHVQRRLAVNRYSDTLQSERPCTGIVAPPTGEQAHLYTVSQATGSRHPGVSERPGVRFLDCTRYPAIRFPENRFGDN